MNDNDWRDLDTPQIRAFRVIWLTVTLALALTSIWLGIASWF